MKSLLGRFFLCGSLLRLAVAVLAVALLSPVATADDALDVMDPLLEALALNQPELNPQNAADVEEGEEAAEEQGEEAAKPEEPSQSEEAVGTDEDETEETQPPADKPDPIGEPLSAGMIKLLQREMVEGFKRRNISDRFGRFQSFAAGKMNATARYSGSELTGNCRLSWYDHLMRNAIKAPAEAEQFTKQLHENLLGDHRGLAEALATAGTKLDLRKRKPVELVDPTSPEEALDQIAQAIERSQIDFAAALAPLSKSEIGELSGRLYTVMVSQNRVGHTLHSRGSGRRLLNLLEKSNRTAMHSAAEAMLPITNRELLRQLAALPEDSSIAVEGVTGPVVLKVNTPSGAIVVGGSGQNVYQLDQMRGVSAVIDLGGDDVYHEGTVGMHRPVLVLVDLQGNDHYRATKPGVQGSAILGISMLIDVDGNDVYQARDMAQASCMAGAGILIDHAGNDTYVALRRVQGQALAGVGILLDRAGNDRYHAALWSQGMGAPLGFAVLDDLDGKDHYYTGGMYLNSYLDDDAPTPGYEGWGQGVGAGLRAVSNGGIGVILDGGGDDLYEYDYLSHGGGYWCGVGFARDFGGNDQRIGATRKAYNGGPRTQRKFVRFSNGYGCHYALGFLFDDRGNDTYNGTIMSVGFAWDCAIGYLCDFGGDDRYSGNEGNGAQAGLGVLFDYAGNDHYLGYKQGRASGGVSYHDLPYCGGNFGFVVDYGGEDKYGSRAKNNSYLRRSSSGGFLIDRPAQEQNAERTATKPAGVSTAGS